MVNLKSMTCFLLADTTAATSIAIPLASLPSADFPIGPIIGFISALPGGAIWSFYVGRLPSAHALSRAKIVIDQLGICAPKLFSAPLTINNSASPSESHKFAGRATSDNLCQKAAVRLIGKGLTTDWTRFSNKFAVEDMSTIRGTKPIASLIAPCKAGLAFKLLPTNSAMNYHRLTIAHNQQKGKLVAAEQLGRICYGMEIEPRYCEVAIARWEAYTGQQGERADA